MPSGNAAAEPQAQAQPPAFLRKEEPRTEAQLREDQRREALRREQSRSEEAFPVETPPASPAPRVEEARIDSKALLESAGLVMIETDRSKAPAQPQAEEPQHLGRPRRDRPKAQPQDEELVQIETTRK